jgi:YHS domain-containing protein
LSLAQDKNMMNTDKMMKKDTMMLKDKMMSKDKMIKNDHMMQSMMARSKNEAGVAINGTDPVAYFMDHKSVMGDAMYSYKWGGADWHFASEKDLEMFKANPNKYAPQYGGYCAYAVGRNQLVRSGPNAWTIKNGKLYLNKDLDVRQPFRKDINKNIKLANEMWPKLNMSANKIVDNKIDNKMNKN